jgi:hypothetical protein
MINNKKGILQEKIHGNIFHLDQINIINHKKLMFECLKLYFVTTV